MDIVTPFRYMGECGVVGLLVRTLSHAPFIFFSMANGIRKVRNPGKTHALFFGRRLTGAVGRLLFDRMLGPVFACRQARVVGRDGFDGSGKHLTDSTARSMPRSGQCRKSGFGCSTLIIFDTEASKN